MLFCLKIYNIILCFSFLFFSFIVLRSSCCFVSILNFFLLFCVSKYCIIDIVCTLLCFVYSLALLLNIMEFSTFTIINSDIVCLFQRNILFHSIDWNRQMIAESETNFFLNEKAENLLISSFVFVSFFFCVYLFLYTGMTLRSKKVNNEYYN